jgi:23S rRNA (guanosine2251-2'-O)-methyltransferase
LERVATITPVELSTRGYHTAAAVVQGGSHPDAIDPAIGWAVLIGSEVAGLEKATSDACEITVSIPMASGDSLNAASAGAILAYRLSQASVAGQTAR